MLFSHAHIQKKIQAQNVKNHECVFCCVNEKVKKKSKIHSHLEVIKLHSH